LCQWFRRVQGQFENAREICARPAIDSGSPSPFRLRSLRNESVGRNGDAEMTFIATSTLTLAEERYRVAVVVAFSLNSPCNKTHPRDVKTTRGCANITATANTSPAPPIPSPPSPSRSSSLAGNYSLMLQLFCAVMHRPIPRPPPSPVRLSPPPPPSRGAYVNPPRRPPSPENHANVGFNLRGERPPELR